jgi:hypothetical protein
MYRGAYEVNGLNVETEGLSVENGQEVPVIDAQLSEIALPQYSAIMTIQWLRYDAETNTFIDSAGETITPYDTFKTGFQLKDGYYYNATGVIVYFNGTREIAPVTTDGFAPAEDWTVLEVDESKWATFVASIDVTVPEGVEAYRADAVGRGGVVEMTKVANGGGVVSANTPVLLYSEEPVTLEVHGHKALEQDLSENGLLVGTLAPNGLYIDAGAWVLQELNGEIGFYQVPATASEATTGASNFWLPCGKAYLVYDGEITFVKLNRPGTTGISQAPAAAEGQEVMYDLSGRRVKNAQKGIYIVNGRKVLR